MNNEVKAWIRHNFHIHWPTNEVCQTELTMRILTTMAVNQNQPHSSHMYPFPANEPIISQKWYIIDVTFLRSLGEHLSLKQVSNMC